MRIAVLGALVLIAPSARAADTTAVQAEAVLKMHCHRCHGRDGAIEGGMNYVLDPAKLVARRKVVPGRADQSPLYQRVVAGKMPPADEPRPTAAEIAVLKQWIDAGAPPAHAAAERAILTEAAIHEWILADLETRDKRARRFTRYFSLAALANAGAGPDELLTYRHALSKLLNSLSWHRRVSVPTPVDPAGVVLRIDLRDYLWDANLWNRVLADYPYGVLPDTAIARAVMVGTATRMPVVRLDWFVATASRAPLYYDLLQLPTGLAELERQLRVDAAVDIQQERVARAGFNGSGISRNNRVLERHDALHGAYWRTYDFDAVPQNLIERDTLLPDRRNLFAYPLGPGFGDNAFQHAGGEAIFNLPNGLQGYILVNAVNQRLDKANTAIVSDPKRPDRAVEAGLSCMNCHARGILSKDDQIRDHLAKNPKAFGRADAELIRALYAPKEKMRALMEEDAERFRKAVEKTGGKIGLSAEVVMTLTLRYEADVDLATLASEAGVKPDVLLARLKADGAAKNLGALKVPGGTTARQVVAQAFGELARDLRLGSVLQPGVVGQSLPDNTGELDPLESQNAPANAVAFSADGKLAAFASADRTVRLWDVEAARELRRCIGHTASVWCVAFSPDGTRLLSGGKDGSVRLWDVETARELRRLDGHTDLVASVAFAPDGHRALSVGLDRQVLLWEMDKGEVVSSFSYDSASKVPNVVAFAPDAKRCLVGAGRVTHLVDAATGKPLQTLTGHGDWVTAAAFAPDGGRVLTGSDDGTLRLWDAATGKEIKVFKGHEGGVKAVAWEADGRRALSGGADATLRLWDVETGKELRAFRKHAEPVVAALFVDAGRQTLSASRDGNVLPWKLTPVVPSPPKETPTAPPSTSPRPEPTPAPRPIATVSVGGTIGALLLSPNGRWLYYLNLTDAELGRIDTTTGRRDRTVRLAAGADTLALSPNGKALYATAVVPGEKASGRVQVIDPTTLEVRNSFTVDAVPYDVTALDSGVLLVSGGTGDWTDVSVIDANKGAVVGRWGSVWTRSFLRLAPDSKRLYVSSQGVSPGTLDALVIPAKTDDKPVTYRAAPPGRQPLGGEFLLTPDGRFLLCKNGTVLRLSSRPDNDLRYHTSLEPFTAAAVDADAHRLFVLTRDGTLDCYGYPDFRLQSSQRLGLVTTHLVCDGKRLYIGGFDPRAVGERPRARGFGDVFVYEVNDVMK